MALTAALHGAMIRNARGKGESCVATILLESSSVKPYGKVVGKLILKTESEFKHFGIRVQFEAVCSLQYETKFDSRVNFHKRTLNVISKFDTDSEGYQISPVMVELIENRPTLTENHMKTMQVILNEQPTSSLNLEAARPHVMKPGIHNLGFELQLPGDVMPAPFRSPYGSLIYKVVAYIKNECAMWMPSSEKSVRFPGFFLLNPEDSKEIHLEKTLKKSVFSSKKFVTAIFKVEKNQFLAEEDIPFRLEIANPKAMPVNQIVVSLVQKITYSINGANKVTTSTLDKKEYHVTDMKPETDWHNRLKIKKKQIPTFTSHPMYNVNHMITYKIQLNDYGSLKGEAPIYIGTTRETVEELEKAASLPDEPDFKVPKSLKIKRQGSSASTMSTTSELECSARSPPITPSEEQEQEVCDDQLLESAVKKIDELSVSPTSSEHAGN